MEERDEINRESPNQIVLNAKNSITIVGTLPETNIAPETRPPQ